MFLQEGIVFESVRVAFEAIKKVCKAMDEMKRKAGRMVKVSKWRLVPEKVKLQLAHLAGGIEAALATVERAAPPAPLWQ